MNAIKKIIVTLRLSRKDFESGNFKSFQSADRYLREIHRLASRK